MPTKKGCKKSIDFLQPFFCRIRHQFSFINLERNAFVSGRFGEVKISSGVPYSQITPSFMNTT